ncbi:uncharacterized protein LOC121729399 [Aricia agestis]|uniref:uncharacterized protein LOC121729399 n=1 Tax=Aricia agestis TaxID=91739 RepID=UPI001C20B891|nr:uncharacterized protein LOC121729399 [Aricia agestis]
MKMLKKVTMKKQPKITKMFRQAPKKPSTDDCDDLEEEVRQLELKLKETHNKLFQIQRNKYRQKVLPSKKTDDSFVRPEKIFLTNSVESLKNELELMTMLSGVEVQSYVAGDHCCIVYHMQHGAATEVKHGLRIEMDSDKNTVTKSSLPVGFNFKAVMEDYKNILLPECLCSIRNGLVAYYDRLEQYDALKNLLNIEAELFKILDGSHIEVSFYVHNINEEEEEQIPVKLILDYRVYDIRPKTYSFEDTDLPDDMADTLKTQCVMFKKKPLQKAFKEAFMNGIGPFNLVQQLGVRQEKLKTKKPSKPHTQYNNDDTFRPEDCSDQGEDFFEE